MYLHSCWLESHGAEVTANGGGGVGVVAFQSIRAFI